ncbi:MAG: efflux RND transporter permease subunit [Hyphomicrobiaceae bacterium]|nr:efflux RND transporter permease subunit [Hyphomicrobiaceae bacterium]
MNISAWSIRRPVPSLVLFLVLMVLGVLSFQRLAITRFPNIDVPIVQVRISQLGAAPAELETQVTKKVEDAIAGVSGVKHITSTLTEGSSTTVIEFRLETNQDRALNDVKDAIARVRSDLPRTIEEPIVQRFEIEGLPILTYAARAPAMTPEELSWFVDDTIVRALQGVKGVSQVQRIGGVDREIRISLDPDRLLAFGITAGDVNRQVKATNIDLAGGRGEIGASEQAIRTLGGRASVTDLAGTMIALPGGRKVRLDELGSVTDAHAETRTFATLDGRDVVAFAISRASGASDVVVSADVTKVLKKLKGEHPDIEISTIDTTTQYAIGSYHSTMTTLIEGAVLAILVIIVFLRDWRATLIAAVALPLSIMPTFWAMQAMGFSLNLVSLLAITIVTGILVDDAIVEIENIVRHMRMGKSAYRAALEAADEIGLAVIAITLTIIAVFVPVSFMGGIAGQYFKQFGLTVAFAVFFSLLVARLVTPMLAAYFMREAGHEEREGWMLRVYTRLVGWSVRHRLKTVALGLIVFAASIGSFYLVPSGFLPPEDSGRMLLAIELPPGSRIEATRAVTDEVARRIANRPEVKTVFVNGGTLLGSGAEVRKATLTVNLVARDKRTISQDEARQAIGRDLGGLPDIRYWFLKDDGQRQFALVVSGRDGMAVGKVAAALASEAKRVMSKDGHPMLANVVSTAELDRPELIVTPRYDIAADLGVSTDQISEAIRLATIGDVNANLARLDIADRQIPIRVQLDEKARGSRDMLEALKVQTARGGHVPLAALATFSMSQGPTSIDRYDRSRRVLIGADLVGDTPLGDALAALKSSASARNLPEGVEVKEFGDAEIMAEVFQGFAQAMGAGLMMVYAVLVLLFGSFLHPITILFSLPLSIGGAIVALAVTAKPMSLPVVIGILMLMGIVTKNAIMLVDFAVEEMAKGIPRAEAIVDAGRKRARPIIMTTIAMVGGMLPSAFAIGDGGEFRAPMAIAVIGGLISSTLLSLVFVPAVFVALDDLARLLWRGFGWMVGPVDEPVGAGTGEPAHSPTSASVPRAAAAE